MLAVAAVNFGEVVGTTGASQLAHCYVMLALQIKHSFPTLFQILARSGETIFL